MAEVVWRQVRRMKGRMLSPRKKVHKRRDARASLLSPEASGGISAGSGFDFQTRYAACNLPVWMQKADFHQLFFEGTGDIDIRFLSEGKSFRIHIQTKDHEVSRKELRSVVEDFWALDSSLPNTYTEFVLVCPSLSATVRPVETAIKRYRGAVPFYDDASNGLAPTKLALCQRLKNAGLGCFIDFILAKLSFDLGHGDLRFDDRALELFVARILNHPAYSGKQRAKVQPAFSELMRTIAANRGKVLARIDLENILQAAVLKGEIEEKGITVWVQNWTRESFDRPADYALDWSAHFDRSSRRVPSSEVWDNELLPSLRALQKQISVDRPERLIRLRGKCALSTGVAMGAVFPAVGSWVFEIPQPPSKINWRSDAALTFPYDLRVEINEGDSSGKVLVLGLNIRNDGRRDITDYVKRSRIRPRLQAFFSPPTQGAQAIGGAEDACAFAHAARDCLGRLLKQQRLRHTCLFVYGPLALAVFLGQQLTSVGEVQLYEYQNGEYKKSCLIKT